MIVYNLSCQHDHRFEGWFASAAEFERQQAQRLVLCPVCDIPEIRRMPAALAIATSRTAANADEQVAPARGQDLVGLSQAVPATAAPFTVPFIPPSPPPVSQALAAMADAPLSVLQTLVRALIESSEDVGSQFAAEARRIHYDEAPVRPIRGQTTEDECAALLDEGIELLRLPVFKKESLN